MQAGAGEGSCEGCGQCLYLCSCKILGVTGLFTLGAVAMLSPIYGQLLLAPAVGLSGEWISGLLSLGCGVVYGLSNAYCEARTPEEPRFHCAPSTALASLTTLTTIMSGGLVGSGVVVGTAAIPIPLACLISGLGLLVHIRMHRERSFAFDRER